jgi:hypothetical protein
VPDQAREIEITDAVTYARAGEALKTIKDLRAQIEDTFGPVVRKAFEAHREAVAQRKKVEAPLIEAENILKPRINRYLEEEERKRRAEEARLQAAAQKQLEDEQLAEAEYYEQAGDTEAAEEVLAETRAPAPVMVPASKPRVQGITRRKTWSAQVTDIRALIRAVADGKAPINCLKADMVFLNQQARSMKGTLNWPGVKAVSDSNISAGRR